MTETKEEVPAERTKYKEMPVEEEEAVKGVLNEGERKGKTTAGEEVPTRDTPTKEDLGDEEKVIEKECDESEVKMNIDADGRVRCDGKICLCRGTTKLA